MTDTPDRSDHEPLDEEDIEQTINTENEVDEASFESFPASDPPGIQGGRVDASDYDEAGSEEHEEDA